jgi:hypothetical protein
MITDVLRRKGSARREVEEAQLRVNRKGPRILLLKTCDVSARSLVQPGRLWVTRCVSSQEVDAA